MRILFFLSCLIVSLNTIAQYTTPGTGVIWNLEELAANSGGSITSDLEIIEDITISLNDSISITEPSLKLDSGVRVTVFGDLNISNSIISAVSFGLTFDGFRLEESAEVVFSNNSIYDCGGIKVLTPNFIFENNEVSDCPAVITTGGFIELSNGKPIIRNNDFEFLAVSGISSAANSQVAPIIDGNSFVNNVQNNTNRPQINLGLSGASDTTMILNNQIIGSADNEMVGGLAFSSLVGGEGHVVIANNTINNNRYGIAILGNGLTTLIDGNEIYNNNTQNLPNLGGSGINLNGNETSFAVLSNNTIEDNLWGVTVQGTFNVAMGDNDFDQTSPGGNRFSNNGNDGNLYALFNNTPNEISALHNCWETSMEPTLEIAESVISHVVDDTSLGEVFFNPMGTDCQPDGISNLGDVESVIEVYPNPSIDDVSITWSVGKTFNFVQVYTMNGQLIPVDFVLKNNSVLLQSSNLNPGFYLLKINIDDVEVCKKLIVQ